MANASDAAIPSPGDEPELEALLAPVLDLPPSAQPDALAEVCRAHPDRAEVLRRRHAILCRFGLDSEVGQVALAPAEILPGQRFGSFRILERLGRGGMGVVYLAEDLELGRQIALKLIRPEFLDSERARERFRREVAVAARLDHPGICTVYGTGVVEGQPYLALQHLRGETLEAMLREARGAGRTAWSQGASGEPGSPPARKGPDSLRQPLELVEQLARAVHCAHEAGLVHRDLKPGNVMVTQGGRPVLMDFGLARAADSSSATLTGSGELIGTPAYMAPEQVAPKGRVADRRTDVYALGVLLYECLTLRPPYPGIDREELYHHILGGEPVELRRLQPAASRDLATVVHKALAKEPARRYPTALELAEDLRRVLDGAPTRARPPGPLRRAGISVVRHRAVAAVGAALMVGLVSSLWLLRQSVHAEHRHKALAIVARAREIQPEDPRLALEAMREALSLSAEPEVLAAIHDLLPDLKAWSPVPRDGKPLQAIAASPSRRFFVLNCEGGPATLHAADGSALGELQVRQADGTKVGVRLRPQRPAVAFAPDESAMWAAVDGVGPCRFELASGSTLAAKPPGFSRSGWWMPMSLAWGPRDQLLVTWIDETAKGAARASLHDAKTGRVVEPEIELPSWSWGCAFLDDGRLVLPSGIWSGDGKTKIRSFDRLPPGDCCFVRVAGDRIALATTGGIQVYTANGELVCEHVRADHRSFERLQDLEWSPGKDSLLVSFQDGQVWIVDGSTSTRREWPVGSTCDAHFMPDGERIVTGDGRGRVILWDRNGRQLDRFLGHRHNARVAPLVNGDVLVASWDGCARVWHVDRELSRLPMRPGFRYGATLLVGDCLVVSDEEGCVRALDAEGHVRAKVAVRRGMVSLALHTDRRSIWVASFEGGELWRWDLRSEQPEGPFPVGALLEGRNAPASIAHLRGGRVVFANGFYTQPKWFDPETRQSSLCKGLDVSHVAAAESKRIAVAVGRIRTDRGVVESLLLLSEDGRSADLLATHPEGTARPRASALAVDRDGRVAVVGHMDGAVSLWSITDKRHLETWRDHAHMVVDVAISPDGRHVASATRQGHLVIRELGARDPVLTWRSTEESLFSLAFFDDHRLVSTGQRMPRLRSWWWEPERLKEVIRRLDLPRLSPLQEQDKARLVNR